PGDFGHKSKLIADIGRALEASVYLSGTGGGKVYNDTAVLHEHGIELIYSKFEYPRYTQLWDDFTADLSILDVLFNCGPETRRLLES
ncbi:MAG: WbqC family protein, partial [Calditrichaeota bacterium]|nr:WbqC family protein [Calditrichota bacterium]